MADRPTLAVQPQSGESIHSMVLRLAPLFMVNVFDFVRFALNVAGAMHIVATRIEALWRMAEMAGWNAAEIEGRKIEPTSGGIMIYHREVPQEWIDLRVRRVAPGVLASDEIPFHRISWHPYPIECDLASGEVLIDRCPQCDAILGWSDVETVYRCGACEFDLRKQQPTYVPEDRLLLARGLHSYLDGTGTNLPLQIQALDDISKAYAMEWLAFFVDLPVGRCLRPSCNNAALGLAEVRRWPQSFDEVMTRFLSSTSFAPSLVPKGRMILKLTEAIERAGTPALRHLLLDRAIQELGKSTLSDVVVSDRIFGRERDVRKIAVPRTYDLSLREVLRIDSTRAIQSATSVRPRAS